MPSIKFSALVSDIKGKANGSVFSKNKQGNYFRNNVTGGGRKSASWDFQKSNFAFLAKSYRGLTAEQKQAWQTMAPNYPSENKFKDSYIPSGFQLFMRLNGVLHAKQLPLLIVPVIPREFPSLSGLSVYRTDFQAYMGEWGAGFNIPSNPLINGNEPYCPQCYVQGGVSCEIGMPEIDFLNCFNNLQVNRILGCSTGCTTSADCETQGMTAPNNEVCCQDGVCNWCGDGLVNMYQGGYLLNVAPGVKDGGIIDNTMASSYTTFNFSFRLWLDSQPLAALQVSGQPVVLVSNFYPNGQSMWVRIVPMSIDHCMIEWGYGLYDVGYAGNLYTNIARAPISYAYLETQSNVWFFQFDLSDENSFKGSVGENMEFTWDFYNIDGWVDLKLNYDWEDVATARWNTANYQTTAVDWGIMLGAGASARQYPMNFSDFRWNNASYTDEEMMYTVQGFIVPSPQVIVAMAYFDVEDCCSSRVCRNDAPCTWNCGQGGGTGSCTCGGSGVDEGWCLTSNTAGLKNYGSTLVDIPGFQFVCPAYDFVDSAEGDYSLTYNGNYLPYGTYPTHRTNAIFAPSVNIDIPICDCGENFYLIINASKPAVNYSVNRTTAYQGRLVIGDARVFNIWYWLVSNIGNYPAGSSVFIDLQILDASTGQTMDIVPLIYGSEEECKRKKKKHMDGDVTPGPSYGPLRMPLVRFKAGSDLSSSVN